MIGKWFSKLRGKSASKRIPLIGDTVHLIDPYNIYRHNAATVTHVTDPDTLELAVFRPRLPPENVSGAKFDPTASKLGTWHWPEKD